MRPQLAPTKGESLVKISRLKNMVIVILLLVNVCLLLLLAGRSAQEYVTRTRTEKELVRLFAANGIDLPTAQIPHKPPPVFPAQPIRDRNAESALAEAILGVCVTEDVGGGAYRYQSELGECLFRANGALEASLERPVRDWEMFCNDLFSAYGYRIAAAEVSAEGTGTAAVLRQLSDGAVFNAPLILRFEHGSLLSVSGVFLADAEPVGDESSIDGVTALVRFFDYSKRNGEVCTAVTDMHAGYLLRSTALVPAWRITTDVNRYYVDRMTGEVTRA